MTTKAEDISFVLSGGTGNLNPSFSLGGGPSASPVTNNSLNNLFDDVLSEETDEGHEDYRCIYVFNDGDTAVYNAKLFILNDFDEGSSIEIGIEQKNEIQRITIRDEIVTGGSLTLSYEGKEILSNYNSDLGDWSTTLQSQLNSLTDNDNFKLLKEVSVTAQNSGSSIIVFDISFVGRDGKRNHDTLTVVSNDLVPEVSVDITTPQQGAPINTIASTINVETTPPGGVTFSAPSKASPLSLPYIKSNEGFPVWVKRTTQTGTVAVERDGFTLRFSSESLEPLS